MGRVKAGPEHTKHALVGKMVERFNSDLATARAHSLGRDRRVGQVMCYLSLMRSTGLVDQTAIVTCVKAKLQHFSSSRAEGKQAAHYLPGQLKINAHLPWHFIGERSTAEALKGMFGDVEDLPADFNKADSAAEAYRSVDGLKNAFAQSCKIVVHDPKPPGGNKINRSNVRRAFQDWVSRSRLAYRNALDKKRAKVNVPELKVGAPGGMHYNERDPDNLDARHMAMIRDQHHLNQTDFLEQYLKMASPENLTNFQMDSIEKNFSP
jgi:hypothetical protein